MSEHIPIDEARFLPVQARTDELDQLETFVKKFEGYIDEAAIRRHIVSRRVAVVALASAEAVQPPEPSIYGRTISGWHKFLTADNIDVPSSRYGRNASEVAWWAVAELVIYNEYVGETDDIDEFANNAMAKVVNDDPSTAHFVRAHAYLLPHEVLKHIDWDDMELDEEPVQETEPVTQEIAAEAVIRARIDEVLKLREIIKENSVSNPPWWARSVVDVRVIDFKLDQRVSEIVRMAKMPPEGGDK